MSLVPQCLACVCHFNSAFRSQMAEYNSFKIYLSSNWTAVTSVMSYSLGPLHVDSEFTFCVSVISHILSINAISLFGVNPFPLVILSTRSTATNVRPST